MDYYERKAKTIGIIEKMIERGYTRKDIHFCVLKNTVMSSKFVDDYINEGISRGLFEENKTTGEVKIPKNRKPDEEVVLDD